MAATTLCEGVAHATIFAFLGILVYLVWRRWSPAAGSLAAATTLVLMTLVSALSFCPWPRWAPIFDISRLASIAAVSAQPSGTRDETSQLKSGQRTTSLPSPARDEIQGRPPEATFDPFGILTIPWRAAIQPGSSREWRWLSWAALAVVGTMALGLFRLATGLWAMRRLRSLSAPLLDPAWRDDLDILRAEMGCRQPVELRSSANLDTPATFGCRRVLILLPGDCQTWDDAERRAVLAHELAHVCRGDFLTGLLAQVCLASQFYHPLAHWLSARLRLEQELAADAWSARLSGGNLPYLTTLAQLALRRDDRALGWPARAFLPSRGTFVRRIEMLRNSKHVHHALLSSRSRILTIGLLAACSLVVAGLRGPISPLLGQAQTASARAAVAGRLTFAKGEFDLSYLPVETKMFVAAQPASLLSHPEMAPAVKLLKDGPLGQSGLGIAPEAINQIVVFWEGAAPGSTPSHAPVPVPPPSGFIMRSTARQDWKTALGRLVPDAREVEHAGKSYLRPGQASQAPMCAYLADENTVVLAGEELLRRIIEDRDAPAAAHSWDEAWKALSKGQLNAVFETRWLRRGLNRDQLQRPGPGGLTYETIAPLFEKTRAYAVGIHANGELKTDLVSIASTPDSVKPLTETLQALLTLGRNALRSQQREIPQQVQQPGEAQTWVLGIMASLLDRATIEFAGQTVHMRSSCPVERAQESRVVSLFLQGARTDAQRQQNVNNLKQIGLAFHNYADARGHFPPPVLYGGSTGKVPYSWRVAILPFLEQSDLYSQYNFDEPWDGPNNRKLIDKMPSVYGYPSLTGSNQSHPAYFVFTGPETILGKGDKPSFADVFDGTSNTILAVDASRDIPWTKPEDIPFDSKGPLPEVGGFTPDGFDALFGDGSVKHIKKSINPTIFKALITRAGGEVIDRTSF
jgi:beta-lactamase regulating signal transducer with metallopeptidase domain